MANDTQTPMEKATKSISPLSDTQLADLFMAMTPEKKAAIQAAAANAGITTSSKGGAGYQSHPDGSLSITLTLNRDLAGLFDAYIEGLDQAATYEQLSSMMLTGIEAYFYADAVEQVAPPTPTQKIAS